MTQGAERRRYTRVAVDVHARIHVPECETIEGRVRDISLGGVLVACDAIPPDGVQCGVELDVPVEQGGPFEVAGATVRSWEHGAALAFKDVAPEIWYRLIDLLTTNEFDAARIRREATR